VIKGRAVGKGVSINDAGKIGYPLPNKQKRI
jgi:hypothetical protein